MMMRKNRGDYSKARIVVVVKKHLFRLIASKLLQRGAPLVPCKVMHATTLSNAAPKGTLMRVKKSAYHLIRSTNRDLTIDPFEGPM